MIKNMLWCLAAGMFTLSAAEPSIYFSLDRTTRADYGGTGIKATVAGLQEPSGVKSVLLVQKSKTKYHADDLLRGGISGKAFPIGKQESGAPATGHDWVHHEAVGHYQWVYTCYCGTRFYDYDEWYAHSEENWDNGTCGGFEAHQEWIVDENAYDECSICHATR